MQINSVYFYTILNFPAIKWEYRDMIAIFNVLLYTLF